MFYRNRPYYQTRSTSAVGKSQVAPSNDARIQALDSAMKDLWIDYVWRTRNYIVNLTHPKEDHAAAKAWAAQNIEDIRNFFSIYYAPDVTNRLKSILTDQLDRMRTIANYLMNTPNEIDLSKDMFFNQLRQGWKSKFTELNDFFSGLNPQKWNTVTMRNSIDDLQELWFNQIISRDRHEWSLDLSYADRTFKVAGILAKILSEGIVEQNPGKFV